MKGLLFCFAPFPPSSKVAERPFQIAGANHYINFSEHQDVQNRVRSHPLVPSPVRSVGQVSYCFYNHPKVPRPIFRFPLPSPVLAPGHNLFPQFPPFSKVFCSLSESQFSSDSLAITTFPHPIAGACARPQRVRDIPAGHLCHVRHKGRQPALRWGPRGQGAVWFSQSPI